jgi:hypothetical protein
MSRVLPLACLCLLGCESVADVVAQHRAGVEKTLSAVQGLAPRVAATGPVFTTQVKAAPVVLEGSSSNAMFIYAEDLPKPGAARPVQLRSLDSVPLLQCGSLLSTGTYFADTITRPAPSVVGQYLGACERLEYVLVIRKVEFTPPLLSLETKKFASGVYRAEVLVFELRSGTLLGGYLVSATNEDSVMLLDGDADHSRRLMSNLESTVFSALREATRQAIPGSLPPAK